MSRSFLDITGGMGWLGISGGADPKIGKANLGQPARTTFSEWQGRFH
jgi:hypothetical protein